MDRFALHPNILGRLSKSWWASQIPAAQLCSRQKYTRELRKKACWLHFSHYQALPCSSLNQRDANPTRNSRDALPLPICAKEKEGKHECRNSCSLNSFKKYPTKINVTRPRYTADGSAACLARGGRGCN